jgi:hypothetical protein
MAMNISVVHAIVPINDSIDSKQGVSGSFRFGFNGQSGNKDKEEYSIDSLNRYRDGDNLFVFIGDYNYSETNSRRDEDELLLHGRWVAFDQFSDSVDSELFVQYEFDDFADLSSRELVGGNVRWRNESISSEISSHSLFGIGAFHEIEQSERSNIREENNRLNLYTRFVYEKKGDHPYTFLLSTYLQPNLSDEKDLRALGLASINFPILPSVSIAFQVEINHNSTPFSDVEKTDIDYGMVFKYTF